MRLSAHQIEALINTMVKMSKEIEVYRSSPIYPGDDDEYVGYREGYYDACHDVLTTLGYSVSEINQMEEAAGV